MILLIRKRKILSGVAAAAVLLAFCTVLRLRQSVEAFRPETGQAAVIIDPGHGGEDGGAVAADGTVESGVNLAIALQLRELFRFCGEEPLMTRETDISIYSDGAETLRQKKVSDLKNRVALVNAEPGAVLISIHQNSLSVAPSVHGAQVFYNPVSGAASYAASVQEMLNTVVNSERPKAEKAIDSTIYLMQHVENPAILVECGFLSNAEETAALKTETHQMRLALAILCGYYNNTEEPVT
ncbi:MAG: N-acetylmuramoyl-L-alanine amidase [Oscillospiraceae bacterium]